MTRIPHPALVWTANLAVPGSGLVLLGRLAAGFFLGAVWGAVLCGLILAALVWPDSAAPAVVASLGASAAAVYAAAQIILLARWRAAARHAASAERDEIFKTALVAYLQGRLDDAEAACWRLLALDPDDVEATLHLATIARHRGDAAAARRYLARTRYLDDDGRWDFQIERELAALAAPAGK